MWHLINVDSGIRVTVYRTSLLAEPRGARPGPLSIKREICVLTSVRCRDRFMRSQSMVGAPSRQSLESVDIGSGTYRSAPLEWITSIGLSQSAASAMSVKKRSLSVASPDTLATIAGVSITAHLMPGDC